jgi:hypothetical protein
MVEQRLEETWKHNAEVNFWPTREGQKTRPNAKTEDQGFK